MNVYIVNEKASANAVPTINQSVADHYFNEIQSLSNTLNLNLDRPEEFVSLILKMPDILSSPIESIDPEEYSHLKNGLIMAISQEQKMLMKNY